MRKKTDDNEGVIPLIRLAESYTDVATDVSEGAAPEIDREAWLRERKGGIGGSDVGAIMGVDPYRSRLDVYHDKVGDSDEIEDNPHMKRGRKLEALVADEYLDRHPEDTLIKPSGIITHPLHPWMLGTPDYTINSPRHKGHGILEIKTPARPAFEQIKLKGIPARYALQIQHYLAITGYEWGTFAIFNADAWELMLIDVRAWPKETQDNLIAAEKKFWDEHVIPRVPPEEKSAERLELPKVEGILRTITDGKFATAVRAYESASEYAKEAEALKEASREAVLDAIHKEPGVFENGEYRVYYTSVEGRKTFDKKALARTAPLDRNKVAFALALENIGTLKSMFADGELDADLSQFEKQGNDFMTMRVYPVKPETE